MAAATSDLNLLYGMLALQLDFVTKDQLLAGMQAWILDKSKRLSQILLEQGVLAPDRQQLLNALVKKHLEAHDNDAQKSIAALNVHKSAREAFKPIRDPDVHASLVHIREHRPGPRVEQFNTIAPAAGKAAPSRFRILRPHAKGGLGVVFVARDEEIGREVALKEIQIHLARDADSRARFELEAEITGGLEHPSIVPVYGLGHYADGRPYYAMRFIRGDSLKEATDQFHKADVPGRDPTERSLALRQLLRHFTDVCNAIEYAHSKGVLHRDLKPGNIMLGRFGETLVVDWGLAKAQGKSESHASTLDMNEAPLTPSSTHNSSQTQMGSAIGTPAFMSPEQAAGRLDLLGAASDVYSLGATLYYVLTGQPSIVAPDLAEVLRCVKRGDFLAPREVNPRVDKALEAICLKAMERESADRYQSALELKIDIDRWLDDSPVTAWREPWTIRARRWLNRHRATAIATVAGVLVAAVILGVSTMLLTRANHELDVAKTVAENSEKRAIAGEKLAVENEAEAKAFAKKADENANEAEKRRLETLDVLRIIKRKNYANTMALAQAAWLDNNVKDAFKHLSASEKEFRGWEYRYLDSAWAKGQTTFKGHRNSVHTVALSPDGQRIVSGGMEGLLRIWNAAIGQEVFAFKKGHANAIHSVIFSPDGKRLFTGGVDKKIKVWDASNGDEIATLGQHSGAVTSLAISANGQRLVSGSEDKTVKLWDVSASQEIATLSGHTSEVTCVAISPDGERIVSGNGQKDKEFKAEDCWLKVWDVAARKELFVLKGHDEPVWCVAFSADGQHIVSGGADSTLRIWVAKTGALLRTLRGHRDTVKGVAFSADGQRLVSGGEDNTVRLWDATAGSELRTLRGHGDIVTSVAFSKDGTRVISGSADFTVKVWDAVHSNEYMPLVGHTNIVNCVAFSGDSRFIVTGSDDGTAKVWDARTGAGVHALSGHKSGITSVVFSGDGKRIVTASRDKTLKFWDAVTGKAIFGLAGHKDEVTSVAMSANGQRIISASGDKTLIVWDAKSGKRLRTLEGHNAPIYSVAISPDGERIVSASDDKSVFVWNAKTGDKIFALVGHGDFVGCVAFSADGQRIATGSNDNSIRVWDANTGKEQLALYGHTDVVWSVAYSADGKRIVSGSADKSLRVWDATNGLETLALRNHPRPVRGVAFSADGQRLVSGGDRTALLREAP